MVIESCLVSNYYKEISMKISDWLEEEQLDILRDVGVIGLVLDTIPTIKAEQLLGLLYDIRFARYDMDSWYEDMLSAKSEILKGRYSISVGSSEVELIKSINLYNKHKYFWLPEVK